MHVIAVSLKSWLVLDDAVTPRFLIVRGPMVNKSTGETHIVHRVEHWNVVPASRTVLAVCDGEMAAREWCAAQIERVSADRARTADALDIRKQPRNRHVDDIHK